MASRNTRIPARLHDQTAFLITDVGRLYRTAFDRRMRRFNLTRAQWWLISFLYFFDGSSQQELADLMDTGKGGIAKLIDRMEKKRLVRRSSDPKDGRSKRVYLAEKVNPLAAEIEREITLTTQRSLSELKPAEISALNQALKSIRSVMIDDQMSNPAPSGIPRS